MEVCNTTLCDLEVLKRTVEGCEGYVALEHELALYLDGALACCTVEHYDVIEYYLALKCQSLTAGNHDSTVLTA